MFVWLNAVQVLNSYITNDFIRLVTKKKRTCYLVTDAIEVRRDQESIFTGNQSNSNEMPFRT